MLSHVPRLCSPVRRTSGLIHIVSRRECEKFMLGSRPAPPSYLLRVTNASVVLALDLAHGKFIALRRSRSLPTWPIKHAGHCNNLPHNADKSFEFC